MGNKVVVYGGLDLALGRKVKRALTAALHALGRTKKYVAVYMVSDAKMKKLNGVYRKRDRVTNVLSLEAPPGFPEPGTPKGFVYLGDIYLAPSFIRREGTDVSSLAIHGILHLLGYAHGKKRDRMKMEKKERLLTNHVINNNRN